MKKNTQLVLQPQLARHRFNPEAATPGEAASAVILRQRDGALEVVGQPADFGSIPAGHRLLLVDGNHTFTLLDATVYCDGNALTTVDGEVLAMHRVGDNLVIVTSAGLIHLRLDGDDCTVINRSDAVPSITLSATDAFSVSQSLDAVTFDSAYSAWSAPLAAADVATITSLYRTAWNAAVTQITGQGAYYTPLQACFGVRLWDDTYLYFSDPVTLGEDTLDNASQVTAAATTSSSTYTGIEATTLSMQAYRLGIEVTAGVGQDWLSLVKAIDIFVTAQPDIADTSSLSYRCVTTVAGTRQSALQYGWTAIAAARVTAALQASGWTLAASTTDLSSLADGQFVASNVAYATGSTVGSVSFADEGTTITRAQVDDVMTGTDDVVPVASIVRNGRLYIASADGWLTCSAHGNALSTAQVTRVTGASILAMAPVLRPLFSAGFGRYAVYLFTLEGIYAVAQSALGVLGEARLVDRSIIAEGCLPVDGNCDIYYTDRNQWLCRLTGNEVTRLVPAMGQGGDMAWDDVHGELYVIAPQALLALTPDGLYSERTVDAVDLYNDTLHALAVTADGSLLDLTHEDSATLAFSCVSHPVVLRRHAPASVNRVEWWVDAVGASLSLSLIGRRGSRAFTLCRLAVDGDIAVPLPTHVVAPPCRAVQLSISGSALSGTTIYPTSIACTL